MGSPLSESIPVVLRSVANPRVRHLVRMRDNRARRKAGRVMVDGWRETAQALDAEFTLCGIYLPESMTEEITENRDEVIRRILDDSVVAQEITWVSDSVMSKICYGQSTRGVVAEFERPVQDLHQLQLPESPLILVLDKIEKPGNVGAVFRCADAVGIDAVLLCDCHELWNPNAIRASLGAVFHVPMASGSEKEVGDFLSQRGIRVVSARLESSQSFWGSDLCGPLAIVLGSEAGGLGTRWQCVDSKPVEGIHLPMQGKVDSLNISVSAALLAFEAVRQRQSKSPVASSPRS